MIKANELRIGNYVEYNLRIFQIDSISEVFPTLNTDEFGIGVVDWNNVSPIQLTEEWLLKFGFTRHHTDYSNGIIYIKDVPNNNEFVWGVYPFELGSGFVINKSKKLKYVHQLQNLYFALTGEELTIKEANND